MQPTHTYDRLRYLAGLPEGVCDLPPGACFPLESNFDLFNGVDFDKGCYLGQELTARSRFVGETRKRLMPMRLQPPLTPTNAPEPGATIMCKGARAGKFRSGHDSIALALLRLDIDKAAPLALTGRDGTAFLGYCMEPSRPSV